MEEMTTRRKLDSLRQAMHIQHAHYERRGCYETDDPTSEQKEIEL